MKPILFNTEMVQAILEERKTVTRRVIKPQPKIDSTVTLFSTFDYAEISYDGVLKLSPYQPGDILYVRETWAKEKNSKRYLYRADKVDYLYKELHSKWKWKPSIHMPKEAARIFLRVTNVSVARLHDITEEDAYREGVMKAHDPTFNVDYWYYKSGQNYMNGKCWAESAKQCFLWGLWNGTLKSSKEYEAYNNKRNPWVWVIEFERITKEDADNT